MQSTAMPQPLSGGFQWNAEWRQQLPVVRGVHVPPLEPAGAVGAITAVRGPVAWNPVAALFPGVAGNYPPAGLTAAEVAAAADQAQGQDAWLQLLALACASDVVDFAQRPFSKHGSDGIERDRRKQGYVSAVPWMVHRCLAANGLAASVQLVLGVWARAQVAFLEAHARRRWCFLLFGPVRHAIAAAAEAEHAAARAVADDLRGQSVDLLRACAHLFPHEAAWAADWLARGETEREPLVQDCLLQADAFLAYQQRHPQWLRGSELQARRTIAALLLQLLRDPPGGFEALAWLVREAFERDTADELGLLLGVAARTHEPGMLPLLASGMALRRVRTALERLAKQHPAPVLHAAMAHALAGRNRAAEGFTLRLALQWPAAVPAALAALQPPQRARFEVTLAALSREPVPPAALPPVLRDPPWLREPRPARLPELSVPVIRNPHRLQWSGTEDLTYAPADSPWVQLQRQGVAAIPQAVEWLTAHPGRSPTLLMKVDAPELVPHVLHVLHHVRLHHATAAAWLRAHPMTAALAALPVAFSATPGKARDDARRGLRWLAAQGHGAALEEAAAAYAGAMPGALAQLLATDPVDLVPDALPALPGWFVPEACRQPELRGGGVLPVAALRHIATMLAISRLDEPYAGLALVKAACTPASLAEFAWDVFEAWFAEDTPAPGRWAFHALGLLGDDETARRLSTRIGEWGGTEGLRGLAEDALPLLAAIGSDVALARLNAFATKARHRRVLQRAQALIAQVADQRGLTMDELGDRLVPTLGLEEPDALELDFGPRRFHLAFDENLAPIVQDARGQRLKDLPKPGKADDAEVAAATVARLKMLRKELRALASLQVARLEAAMRARRRWTLPEFRTLLVAHPLLRHLVVRLVWATCDEAGRCERFFRVAEDGSFATARDEAVDLPEGARVGIAHRLDLPEAQHAAFCQLFADYELRQPFRQLTRETYALTPDEAAREVLQRFEGRDVATGAVLGLAQKGWERGPAGDGGMVTEYHCSDGALQVSVGFHPGMFVGRGAHEPRQALDRLWVARPGSEGAQPARFGDLDPVFASEVLRDLDLLNPALAQSAP